MTLLSRTQQKYHIGEIDTILLDLKPPRLVFLYGEVGAGKTTLVSQYISRLIGKKEETITSPTYVYYNRYEHITHFDLYRLENYDQFIAIGGEEILDMNEGIIFIEWPQILEAYYTPDISIFLSRDEEDETLRQIEIVQ